ncbi:hypothetical protein PG984_012918 [Apiospora sp. TS-2023a]
MSDTEMEASQAAGLDHFLSCQDPEVLHRTISLGSAMLERGIIALDPPTGLKGLHVHGRCLLFDFFQTNSRHSLDNAIMFLDSARRVAGSDYTDLASLLESLCRAYLNSFRLDDSSEDPLHNAVRIGRTAVPIMHEGLQQRERLFSILGNALQDLYELHEELEVLNEAIQMFGKAVEVSHDDNALLPYYYQCHGDGLYARYKNQGKLSDLQLGIRRWKRCIDITPPGDRKLGRRYDDLGCGLFTLYQVNGQLSDLEDAIHCQRSCLKDAENTEELEERRGNLALSIHHKYLRTRDPEVIKEAADLAVSAAEAIEKGHPMRAGLLDQAAVILLERYNLESKDISDDSDLGKAIAFWQIAVGLKSGGIQRIAEIHNNLGNGLNVRYHVTNDTDDLTKAVKHWGLAVSSTPDNHPDLTLRLKNQGIGYHNMFERTGDMSKQTLAKTIFERALDHKSGALLERVDAGRRAAAIAKSRGDYVGAASYYSRCVELLPLIAVPTKSQSDLENTSKELLNLSSETVYAFLKAGKPPSEAIRAMESTRGIISSLTVDLRSDVSSLKQKQPDLSSRYLRLREFLSSTRFSMNKTEVLGEGDNDFGAASLERLEALEQLDQILKQIRSLPGMETFQATPTMDDILQAARDGPVVCFNVTPDGSHAFVVKLAEVISISLPKLTANRVESLSDQLTTLDVRHRRHGGLGTLPKADNPGDLFILKNQPLDNQLVWLWDAAVEPVLSELGLLQEYTESPELPCVWWVRTGAMANLPLHAAGDHSPGSSKNTISHVVSSYATTLKTLRFAQTKTQEFTVRKRTTDARHRVVIIAMPRTSGYYDLKTAEKVDAIKSCIGHVADIKVLENPSSHSVLAELESATMVHFACHATADPVSPSDSYLHLGESLPDNLKLKELERLHHQLADVAYLSACSTAGTQDGDLADESINLSSTFQLVGFRHVVGTLWDANDKAAVRVASAFYEQLLSETGPRSAARALHVAVVNYKKHLETDQRKLSIDRQLIRWACFVHLGP